MQRMLSAVEPVVQHGLREMQEGATLLHTLREVALGGALVGAGSSATSAIGAVEQAEDTLLGRSGGETWEYGGTAMMMPYGQTGMQKMPYGKGMQMPYGKGMQMPYGKGMQMPYGKGMGKQMPYGKGMQMPYGKGMGKQMPYGKGMQMPYGKGMGKQMPYGKGMQMPYGTGMGWK